MNKYISRITFWIYLVAATISVAFIVVFFCLPGESNWNTFSISFGASLISGVLLSLSIEIANNTIKNSRVFDRRMFLFGQTNDALKVLCQSIITKDGRYGEEYEEKFINKKLLESVREKIIDTSLFEDTLWKRMMNRRVESTKNYIKDNLKYIVSNLELLVIEGYVTNDEVSWISSGVSLLEEYIDIDSAKDRQENLQFALDAFESSGVFKKLFNSVVADGRKLSATNMKGVRKMNYYISDKNKEIQPLPNSPFKSLDELYESLCNSGWSEFSVFAHKQWNPNNKASGQCNGTVLLVQKYFGGDIIQYPNPGDGKKGHYFNRIDGVDIDLTSSQFSKSLDYASQIKVVDWSNKKTFEYWKSARIMELSMELKRKH